jgi:hypothetical protein
VMVGVHDVLDRLARLHLSYLCQSCHRVRIVSGPLNDDEVVLELDENAPFSAGRERPHAVCNLFGVTLGPRGCCARLRGIRAHLQRGRAIGLHVCDGQVQCWIAASRITMCIGNFTPPKSR